MILFNSLRLNKPILYWCNHSHQPNIITKVGPGEFKIEYYAINEDVPLWTSSILTFAELIKLDTWSRYKIIRIL